MTELTTWEEWRKIYPAFIGPKGPTTTRRFPGCCHYEENRQNAIDVGNYNHRTGWLPCGDNWWIFRKKNIEHHHYNPLADAIIFVKTSEGTKRLRQK